MTFNIRSLLPGVACIAMLSLVGLALGQEPAPTPTAPRPDLAPDAKTAINFLGSWPRVTSGQDFFKGALYIGSEACKGCHDQQIDEWRKTWHSKILTTPSPE